MSPTTTVASRPCGAFPGSHLQRGILLRPLRTAALVLGALLATATHAAVVQGTVLNQNTRRFLERAIVQVEGTSLVALTDKDGSFRLAGVPAGTHTLIANYSGLDAATRSITVTAAATTRADFELTDSGVYVLNEVVVTSSLEGNAHAVNQQRRAESIRSVTSIDAFIDQATGNPGEFLRSVSGIQMDFSQNEPQLIRVRGMDPSLTVVTMDGNEIASAGSSGTNRRLEVDQLSMALLDNVEVFKAPIPSMSANAIGGSVNFNTKSAFDQQGRRASLQLGVAMDSNDFSFRQTPGPGHGEKTERRVYPVGRLEYSDAFFHHRLGLVFSVGRDHTNQLGSSVTHNLAFTALPGQTLPAAPTPFTQDNVRVRRAAMSFAPNRQLRTRDDISLNTDFKLTDEISLFLKTTFTEYHSTNRNHGFTLTPGALTADSTATAYTTTSGTASQGVSVFDKYTNSWQINPGLKLRSGPWKVDLIGGFSKSTNHYRNPDNFGALSINLPAVGWSMSTPLGDEVPTSIVQNTGADFYNLNNYRPNQGNLAQGMLANHNGMVSTNVRNSDEVRYSARLDVQRDFQARFPFYLKAGFSYNETIRDKQQPQRRWYFAGDDGVPNTADDTTAAGASLGRFAEPLPVTQGIPGFNLREPTYLSTTELFDYWQAHPQVLVENLAYHAQQKFVGRKKVDETVYGAYLMGDVTINRLNVLAGVRFERTELDTLGHRVDNSKVPTGVNINSLQGILASHSFITNQASYNSAPFPYVHLRHEWLPGLQTRASYTQAIGRPNFDQVLPTQTQNDTDRTVTVNRAGLKPQRSENLDASIEYYTKSAGEWTFSWFSRDVENYIASTRLPLTQALLDEFNLGAEFANFELITSQNLGRAKWKGYEIGFRQKLRDFSFVPRWLHGVELFANHTRIYSIGGEFSSATTGRGAAPRPITALGNVVPRLVNAGISYRTPNGKLFVNLITNYQSATLRDINLPAINATEQAEQRADPYQFWNLEVSYKLTPKLRLTATGKNITSERRSFSQVDGIVRERQQATGIAWVFSAKYDL